MCITNLVMHITKLLTYITRLVMKIFPGQRYYFIRYAASLSPIVFDFSLGFKLNYI